MEGFGNLFIVNLQYVFRRHNNIIYLLNFNITNIFTVLRVQPEDLPTRETPFPSNMNNSEHQKQLPTTPLPNTIQTLTLVL